MGYTRFYSIFNRGNKKKTIDIVNYDKVHIDKSSGPVFIENSASVEPFTILRGPIYIGHNAIIKSHSSITNSVIGPGCKIKISLSIPSKTSLFTPKSMAYSLSEGKKFKFCLSN